MWYRLPTLGAVVSAVLVTGSGLVTVNPTLASPAEQDPPVEDYAYPNADQIYADRGIRLKTGDGNILLVDCGDRTDVMKVNTSKNTTFCFAITGPRGYLSLELPETFLAKGDDHDIEVTLVTKGRSETVPIAKEKWTKLGEAAKPADGPATLVEIKATGAPPPPPNPNPSSADSFLAKVDIGSPGIDGRSCTGALIDPQWIATSARCFAPDPRQTFTIPAGAPPRKSTATLGRADLAQNDEARVIDITELAPREDRDLVLAKLARPVHGISPVAIARTAPRPGEVLRVAGYGRTATEWVPGQPHATPFTTGKTTSTTVAITTRNPADTDPCKGDSGAPALRGFGGQVELVAVTSTSRQGGCIAEDRTRGGATEARADNIGDWIRRTVPDLAIVCKPSAPVFTTRDNGSLWLYEHTDPRNGGFSWSNGNGREIGSGWLGTRAIAGPGGTLYQANANGELRRFHHLGNDQWEKFGNQYYEVVNHGWERYTSPAHRNQITVDSAGALYTINPDGKLYRHFYDPAKKTWEPTRVLGAGWNKYDLIVAAGDGVLYTRTPAGELFRHVYDATAGEWTQQAKPSGTGWSTFNSLMSVGGDILYGSYPAENGGLLWYRYLPASDSWAPTGRNQGKLIGQGWYSLHNITAAPDTCRLIT
ncbi:tachylectin-related carbohydrate-binding protein [Amycolatopsis anabasis]|uniref:tachylectin-related carbohydrate-binding protein n=1 Tax=Amycolatopsis anabasis TaxID=1840409 RepID=UPI00131BF70F|nr:tachylectin-related carbohydrate-binding protein [Amycolatopsis anabasis]